MKFFGEFLLLCGFSTPRTGPVGCHVCTSAALIDLAKLFCKEIAPIPITTSWIFQQVFLSEGSNWRTEKRNTSQSKKTVLRMHLMISGTYFSIQGRFSHGPHPFKYNQCILAKLWWPGIWGSKLYMQEDLFSESLKINWGAKTNYRLKLII